MLALSVTCQVRPSEVHGGRDGGSPILAKIESTKVRCMGQKVRRKSIGLFEKKYIKNERNTCNDYMFIVINNILTWGLLGISDMRHEI